jgi:hypothetical protein
VMTRVCALVMAVSGKAPPLNGHPKGKISLDRRRSTEMRSLPPLGLCAAYQILRYECSQLIIVNRPLYCNAGRCVTEGWMASASTRTRRRDGESPGPCVVPITRWTGLTERNTVPFVPNLSENTLIVLRDL